MLYLIISFVIQLLFCKLISKVMVLSSGFVQSRYNEHQAVTITCSHAKQVTRTVKREYPDGEMKRFAINWIGSKKRMNQHHHSEDIGKILLQAQEDLRNLRVQVGAQSDKPIDSNILNGIIARAEEDLKAKAKVVLNGVMNDSMRMLPVLPQTSSHQYAPGHQPSQEPLDATAHILAPRTKKDIADLRRVRRRQNIQSLSVPNIYDRNIISPRNPGVIPINAKHNITMAESFD